MSPILHVVRADIRRWGLLIALSLVLTVAQHLLEERAPILAFEDSSRAGLLEVILVLLTLVNALLMVVIVAAVMQETPIVGRRAFLLTRPITPAQTLVAKLITLGGAFVVVPTLLNFALLASRGLPLTLVSLTAVESLIGWRLLLLLLLLLVAALTESIVGYLVVLASGLVTLTVGLMVAAAFATPFPESDLWTAGDEPYSLDTFETTRVWLTMAVTVGLPLMLVARRRRRQAIVAACVLLALAPIPWWPPLPRLFAPPAVQLPSWTANAATPQIALDRREAGIGLPWVGGGVIPPRGYKRPRVVHVDLLLPGVPAGWLAAVSELRSRFTLRDGTTVEGHGQTLAAGLPRRLGESPSAPHEAWRETLGSDVRMRRVDPELRRVQNMRTRTVVAELADEAEVTRLTTAPVRYDVDLVFDLWRYDVAAIVPQQPARIERDHALFEIVAIRQNDPRLLSVLVRQTVLSPWLDPAMPPQFFMLLKAPDRDETDTGGTSAAAATRVRALSRIPLPGGGWLGADGVETEWLVANFTRDDVEPLAPGWIDRAHLAVVDRRYAGRIRRHLRVDDLAVRDLGNQPPPITPAAASTTSSPR